MARRLSELFGGSFTIALGLWFGLAAATESAPKNPLTLQPWHTEVAKFLNESYMVLCSTDTSEQVAWFDPKRVPVVESRGRVHVESRDALYKGAQALVFEHVHHEDRGTWTCRLANGNHTNALNMTVIEMISFGDTPLNQSAREEQEFTVQCNVVGVPKPVISWSFNKKPIALGAKYRNVDKGLLIANVSLSDKGIYTCRAFQVSAVASNFEDLTINLSVQHKPIAVKKLPLHAKVEQAYGYLGGTVTLACQAVAEPAANFTWHRNGKSIAMSSGRISLKPHMSELTVPIPDRNAYGDYMCKAKNFMGTMERIINLMEGQRPDPPTQVIIRGANSDTLDIEIRGTRPTTGPSTLAPQPNNLPIIGYRFQYMLAPTPKMDLKATHKPTPLSNEVDSPTPTPPAPTPMEEIEEELWENANEMEFGIEDGATYLLTGLQHNSPYYVRVMSRNYAGLSLPSEPLRCHTLLLQPLTAAAPTRSPPAPALFSAAAAALALAALLQPSLASLASLPAKLKKARADLNTALPSEPSDAEPSNEDPLRC